MKPLNNSYRVTGKIIKDLNVVIVKVNGKDLSNATHEETVHSLNAAQEPITVEVLRRAVPITSTENITTSVVAPTTKLAMTSVGTQTETSSLETANCCNRMFIVPAPPPLYSSIEEVAALADSVNELDLCDEQSDELQNYDVEYDLITLKRESCRDRIGLTLCYGEADQDGVADIFIGEVEQNSIADRDGRIQPGDQIIKINNKEVKSRDEAIQLFSENRAEINLLICRPVNLDQMDDGFLDDCGNKFEDHIYDTLVFPHDAKMTPLIEVEEMSEFEEDSLLTDTATLPSLKEKEAKDSGVGHDSPGSSEQECDSSHYDTINPADDVELTAEYIEDRTNFRQLLESRCEELAHERLSRAQQCDNNNRVVPKMGTKLIPHNCNDVSPVKMVSTDTNTDTAYSTADSSPTTLELTKNVSGSSLSISESRKLKKRSHEKKRSRRSTPVNQSASPSLSDITYTTEDKLAETMAYQQQLLLEQSRNSTLTKDSNAKQSLSGGNVSDTSNMEWVVKRKADGTRYVTRRPIRTKILSERKKRLETERCGMTTDDDAVSELKTGRHWSKEDRRRHLQKSREHQQRKAFMQQRIEICRKAAKEGQSNILELSQKKFQKHAMKDMDFVTVQELMAHQGQIPLSSSHLISVTTV